MNKNPPNLTFINDTTKFLRSDGNWAVPPTGGAGTVAIGSAVDGADTYRVLFTDGSSELAQDDDFNFDPAVTYTTTFGSGGGIAPIFNIGLTHDAVATQVGTTGRGWGTFNIYSTLYNAPNVYWEFNSDEVHGFTLHFRKKRATGISTANGDTLGSIQFDGWDGTASPDNHVGASVYATKQGSPVNAPYIGAMLHFLTSSDSGYADRMTIDKNGIITVPGKMMFGPLDNSYGMKLQSADQGSGNYSLNIADKDDNTRLYLDKNGKCSIGGNAYFEFDPSNRRFAIIPYDEPGSSAYTDYTTIGLTVWRQRPTSGQDYSRAVVNSVAGAANFIGIYNNSGDPTTYGYIQIMTANSTATQLEMHMHGGVNIGTPTGGYKGLGTLNCAGDIYKNNTAYTNPDYALEHWATGKIEKYAKNEGAKEYRGRRSLDELEAYCRDNLRLPGIDNEAMGAFKRSDFLLEKVEEIFTYLFDFRHELDAIK